MAAAKVLEVQRISAVTLAAITYPYDASGLKEPCDEWLIVLEGGNVRWSDAPTGANGVTETISSTVGTLMVDGDRMEYRGDFTKLRFILASGTPNLSIHKYQRNTGW